MAKRNGSPWEPNEIAELRRLTAARTPAQAICAQLGRTLKAVQVRAQRENLPLARPTRSPPPHQPTQGQLFILTRLWTENRPLRIVSGSQATLHVQFDTREWGIGTRLNSIDALLRLGYIVRDSGDRYALTDAGRAVVLRTRSRRLPLKQLGAVPDSP